MGTHCPWNENPCAKHFKLERLSRYYLYGYRVDEMCELVQIPLPRERLPQFKRGLKRGQYVVQADRPVSRSLLTFLHGLCPPKPDCFDLFSKAMGLAKRVLRPPPPPNRQMMRRFRRFVHKWIRHNMKALPSGFDTGFEPWLETTDYTQSRKEQLREAYEANMEGWRFYLDPENRRVKSFIKDEVYNDWKYPRWINSRTDIFKCMTGPIFKAIEKEVFKHPAFIKYIPVTERAKYIWDHLYQDGYVYYSTDYTSFESLFTPQLMRSCELQLYKFMSSELPEGKEWYTCVKESICDLPYELGDYSIKAKINGTRMSGEMCTSLGNGFTNLMVALFMCEEEKADVRGIFVEGDDCIVSVSRDLTSRVPTLLGLRIKMERYDNLGDASFCGNVFDPMDFCIVTDPKHALVKFGWSKLTDVDVSEKRIDVLTRAKAMSMAYQYNGCPIVCAFAFSVLAATKRAQTGVKKYLAKDRSLGEWERERLKQAMAAFDKGLVQLEPTIHSRLLVERLYNVSVGQQKELESFFARQVMRGPVSHPITDNWDLIVPMYSQGFHNYAVPLCDATKIDALGRGRKPHVEALPYFT